MSHSWVRNTLAVLVLLAFGAYFVLVREDTRSEGLQYVDLSPPSARETPSTTRAPRELESPPQFPTDESTVDKAPRSEFSIPAVLVTLRGRVVDAQGRAVEGIGVERAHSFLESPRVESDAEGRFVLEVEEPHGELQATGAGWILIGGDRYLSAEHDGEYLLVLAPAVELYGRVLDARGAPVVDAALLAIAPGDALVRFGLVAPPLEHESQRSWSTRDGSFRLGPVPFLPGGRIEVSAPGASPVEFPQPKDPSLAFDLVIGER
jgi:hypothetical protein